MIDTRRAHQMTKMAMFEREQSDSIRIVQNHNKKGYIGFWTMIYSVSSVLVYLLYTFIGMAIMIAFFENGVPSIAWIVFAVVFTSGFVFHTYFCVKNGRKRAAERYDKSHEKNEYIMQQYKILDELYKNSAPATKKVEVVDDSGADEASRKIYE